MNANELLMKAAEYIEVHGWVQGHYGDKGEPCCVVGAMMAVCEAVEVRLAARAQLAWFLGLGDTLTSMWNDAPGRTKDEVVAALRAAAGANP